MTNWRIKKIITQTILVVSVIIAFGFGDFIPGVDSISSPLLGTSFTVAQLIGVGLIYVFLTFNSMTRA